MGKAASIGRIVTYRSRTGDYTCPAIINATNDSLNPKGVELGHVPPLSGPDHVHLTVFTPGKPGMRRTAEDFEVLPEGGHEALSENVAGCYQEWDIPLDHALEAEQTAATWRWPVIAGGAEDAGGGEPDREEGRETTNAGELVSYNRDSLEELEFAGYVKVGTTKMAPVEGPFIVSTKEGAYTIPEGWVGYIALDADGDPYPVELAIAEETYRKV